MRYRVRSKEISELTNNIDKTINDEISSKMVIMDALAKQVNWKGPARDNFVNQYDEVMRKLKRISEFMYLYTEFLSNSSLNYGEALSAMQKKMSSVEEELDIRSMKDE